MIPVVLAMLGENPMQSELSCHVGLAGKYFCRCCWVKGRDADDNEPSSSRGPNNLRNNNDSDSVNSQHTDVSEVDGNTQMRRKGRQAEMMQELIDRARRFMGVSDLQSRMHITSQWLTH